MRIAPYLLVSEIFLATSCSPTGPFEPVQIKNFNAIDTKVEILAGKPGPLWFGPHPVQVFITQGGSRRLAIEDRVANDGAVLSEKNFPISITNGIIHICTMGQEQKNILFKVKPDASENETIEGGC